MTRADRRARARAQAKRRRELERRGRSRRTILPPRLTRVIVLTLTAVVVLGAGGWWTYSYLKSPARDQTIVSTVNGKNITRAELTQRENVFRYLSGMISAPNSETSQVLRQELLRQAENAILVEAETARRGLPVSAEDVKTVTDAWGATLQGLYGSKVKTTVQRLRLGVTAVALEDYAAEQVLTGKLYEAVTADLTVTEADILAWYEQRKSDLDEQGLSLEQARETLAQEALQNKRGEAYSEFIDSLRAQAEIKTSG